MPKPKPVPVQLEPARVDAWRLTRQHLIGKLAATPEEVATDLIGVQAQVPSAACLSIAIRQRRGSVAAAAKAVKDRRLIRSWAMRGTLHLFAADDFPVVIAAMRRRETWRSAAWLRYFKVTEPQMETVIESIGEVLDDGRPRTRGELADALVAKLGHDLEDQLRSSWGTFLKPAANRGYLVQAPTDGPTVAYIRPDRLIGRWREEDPDEALVTLMLRYLAAYGPASEGEILRWWGGQRKQVLAGLQGLTTLVEVDGHRGVVRSDDVDAIAATKPVDAGALLLGPFDPFTLAAGLRDRLIPRAHLKRVSRTAGWISPVVLVDGCAVAVWTSSTKGDRLEITVDTFEKPSAALKHAISTAAERVAAAHKATAHVTYGPVYATATSGPSAET